MSRFPCPILAAVSALAQAKPVPTGPISLGHAGTRAARPAQGGVDPVTIGAQFARVDDVFIER